VKGASDANLMNAPPKSLKLPSVQLFDTRNKFWQSTIFSQRNNHHLW